MVGSEEAARNRSFVESDCLEVGDVTAATLLRLPFRRLQGSSDVAEIHVVSVAWTAADSNKERDNFCFWNAMKLRS